MKTYDLKKITNEMKNTLDGKRYTHTLGVSYTAACLAMRYGESVENAQIAGLLHDNAKFMSDSKKIRLCEKHNISISKSETLSPGLLHAKAGSIIAKTKFNICDQDILNAIMYHTTGRPNMSLLEKIIFVADYIEPSRKIAPRLDDIRKEAFNDIDSSLLMILKDTLSYLEKSGSEIDPMTKDTYDYYSK